MSQVRGEIISDNVLRNRKQPEKPIPIELVGKFVTLKPLLVSRDSKQLFDISNGKAINRDGNVLMDEYDSDYFIWRFMFQGPFQDLSAFETYLLSLVDVPNALCLSIFDNTSRPIGIINLMNNSPTHLKGELGGIWYSPTAQRTSANLEATYLLMKYCFEILGYRRVEWKCDSLNERSRKSATRMGFTFEGIQENHMIVKNRNRDTAWFRVLSSEWPQVKTKLELLLNSPSKL